MVLARRLEAATMSETFDFRAFHRNQRGRMFRSDFLEFFSKVHPAMPFVFWVPVVQQIQKIQH
jgi:hypothetical protein